MSFAFLCRFSLCRLRLLWLVLCCCGAVGISTSRAQAATLTVTTLSDGATDGICSAAGSSDGCTLREAITNANANPDQTDIVISPSLSGTLALQSALPQLSTNLSITHEPGTVSLSGNGGNFGIIRVNAGATITLNSLSLVNGKNDYGAGLSNSGNTTLNGCTVTDNTAVFQGGGIYNTGTLVLNNTTVRNNTVTSSNYLRGGGISNDRATLTLNNSTVSGNQVVPFAPNSSTNYLGGGIQTYQGTVTLNNSTISNNIAPYGGGLFLEAATVTLDQCSVFNNSASTYTVTYNGHSSSFGGDGGGIATVNNMLTLSNCTVSGNSAFNAGGVGIQGTGTGTLSNCTVSNNAAEYAGGIYISATGILGNTIVVGNTTKYSSEIDQEGTLTSRGYNLVGNSGDQTSFNQPGDQTGVTTSQVNLGTLADNGGLTQTMALRFGSIAINAGNPNTTGLPLYDQRGMGYARVVGGRVDVGAYEVQSASLTGAIISEFRARGANGTEDEYVEIYNKTAVPLDIGGWTLQYIGGGTTRKVLLDPNNFIPAFGHYLVVGSTYSLANYGGTGAAVGDQNLPVGIDDGSTLILLNSASVAQDSINFGASGLVAPTTNGQYAFVRQADPLTSLPVPTANAFTFVAVNAGTFGAAKAALGAPGPENLSSPTALMALKVTLLDPAISQSAAPNRFRDVNDTSDINASQGTLAIRRLVTNNTGAPITKLRFRVVNLTTRNSTGYSTSTQADLRAIASPFTTTTIPTSNGNVPVYGTTLDTTLSQGAGGGINSSSVEANSGVLTLSTPLAAGATRAYDFTFGVQRTGTFSILILFESVNGSAPRLNTALAPLSVVSTIVRPATMSRAVASK